MPTCPTCGSTTPHLHPAVQFEGEVETCPNSFHLQPTPQNRPKYIEAVRQKQRAEAAAIEREACATHIEAIEMQEVLLAAGEMTAQERRTVMALLPWLAYRIRNRNA